MAASCSSTARFSLPRQSYASNGILLRSSNSVSRSHLNYRLGLSIRIEKRFGAPKSSYPLLVSCLGDTKAAVVTGKSWDKLILESDAPVLVEFYASWCGPCRMVHRVIDEIASEYSGRLKCFVLDADEEAQLAETYDIKAVPVVLVFKNGVKRESVTGTMPKEFYVAAIERVMALESSLG